MRAPRLLKAPSHLDNYNCNNYKDKYNFKVSEIVIGKSHVCVHTTTIAIKTSKREL